MKGYRSRISRKRNRYCSCSNRLRYWRNRYCRLRIRLLSWRMIISIWKTKQKRMKYRYSNMIIKFKMFLEIYRKMKKYLELE